MFGIQKPRKGLFGSMGGQPPFGTPPIAPEPQWQTSPVAAAQQMPEQKPGLGTRLLGQGWEDKAFALGGMLQGDPRGVMMLQQQKGMQAQAAVDAAQEQRKRAADLADWKWKQEWERANPADPNPYRFEDNAGNVWQYDPATGQNKMLFLDRAPKQSFIPDGLGGGRFVDVPNPYAGAAGNSNAQGKPYNPDEWEDVGGTGSNVGGGFPAR